MARDFVITGLRRGSGERTTLRVRAADERAAGWVAIEKGLEVLSIEPAGGRPAPVGSRPPPLPRTPDVVRLLARLPAPVSLACLLAGIVMTAYAAPSLPRAAAEFGGAQRWYEQERARLKARSGYSESELDRYSDDDPSDWRNYLARVRNTRDTFRAPLLWGGSTVVAGVTIAGLSVISLALRRARRPGAGPAAEQAS